MAHASVGEQGPVTRAGGRTVVVLMSKYEVVNGGGGSDACMYVHAEREGRRVLVGGLRGTCIDC